MVKVVLCFGDDNKTYPRVDLAFEVLHDFGDVVLHHAGKFSLVGDGRDPSGQLRVPDESMAAYDLAVVLCPFNKVVCLVKVESTFGGFGSVPLH